MRLMAWAMAALVAGCAVNEGQNVNYPVGGDSRYDQYRRDREVALTSGEQPPRIIPVALPVDAPTAADITWKPPARTRTVAVATTTTTATTPDLVRFAFAARHAPGTRIWARPGGSAAQAVRACAGHPNADQAQLAFLAAGGPEQDPRGMDPDGDGFVCGWDPAPWRQPQPQL